MSITTDLPTPERALAIAAHPDDIEFGSGATLAKWADAGCEVSLLICTDGSKGTWDANADTDRLVVTRQDEQREAAKGCSVRPARSSFSVGPMASSTRACASAPRSRPGSAGSAPTFFWATTRGSDTGSTPIIDTPGC